jgi:hypothetical protein
VGKLFDEIVGHDEEYRYDDGGYYDEYQLADALRVVDVCHCF